jgi:hypothetical protein
MLGSFSKFLMCSDSVTVSCLSTAHRRHGADEICIVLIEKPEGRRTGKSRSRWNSNSKMDLNVTKKLRTPFLSWCEILKTLKSIQDDRLSGQRGCEIWCLALT